MADDGQAGTVVPPGVFVLFSEKVVELLPADRLLDDFIKIEDGILVKQGFEVSIPVKHADKPVLVGNVLLLRELGEVFLNIDHGCVGEIEAENLLVIEEFSDGGPASDISVFGEMPYVDIELFVRGISDQAVGYNDVLNERNQLNRHVIPVSDPDKGFDVVGRLPRENDITFRINDEKPVVVGFDYVLDFHVTPNHIEV